MLKALASNRSLFALFTLVLLVCSVGTRTAADSQSTQVSAGGAAAATARKPPLYLEVQASVRGALRKPFMQDMTLAPRAQVLLQARTSHAARVYMLHCDARAALSVYPDAGGIEFRADQWVSLPAAGMPIQVGSEPGNETVYVIATRERLVENDAPLERWLADKLRQPQAARCDQELGTLLAGAGLKRASGLPPTAANPPTRKLPYAVRGVDVSKPLGAARAFAENDGIVILRFAYSITR